jgi:hypothetical protein
LEAVRAAALFLKVTHADDGRFLSNLTLNTSPTLRASMVMMSGVIPTQPQHGGEWWEGGGWRVEGGGWRVEGGGWRVEGGMRDAAMRSEPIRLFQVLG